MTSTIPRQLPATQAAVTCPADAHAAPRPRRWRGMAKCVWAMLLVLPAATLLARSPQPEISLEYAVKATYLYKLAPFVNWPPATFKAPDAPFSICVVGPDPFDDFLEKAVSGRRLGTHPFQVRRMDAVSRDDDCQIVFIGYAQPDKTRGALEALQGRPVLTVIDSRQSDVAGSVVQFVMRRGHVRFEIDNAAAARNHLVISSKLLNLALAVKEAG
ncbi:MAG TPA: YfiR family protein [Rhodanobacteraceae bacterium]|nr:YfiR family protein [Rhodanobacteraceae bacterium]